MSQKYIFWDFDGTLGYFEGILNVMRGYGAQPHEIRDFGVRSGIEITLQTLISKGYAHVVTSGAQINYVKKVLQLIGLDGYFHPNLFCRDTGIQSTMEGKYYESVLKFFGLDPRKAKDDVIIIGDSQGDRSADWDYNDIVFIEDRDSNLNDASIFTAIINKLESIDNQSFSRAFYALYQEGERIDLGSGVTAIFEKRVVSSNRSSLVIFHPQGPGYKRGRTHLDFPSHL